MTGTQRQRKIRSAQDADMPLYMRKDVHGYKFVRPIPQDLRDQLGKANFIKRLGSDYRKAKTVCAELTVETDRLLAVARSQQDQGNAKEAFLKLNAWKRLKTISVTPELSGQLGALWLSGLDADAQDRKAGLDDDEFESISENVAERQPRINRALASGQVGEFHNAATQLLLFRGYQLRATDAELQALIGYIPPAEAEANYYGQLANQATAVVA